MLEWQVGDVRIRVLVELRQEGGELELLPQATPASLAEIPWLRPHFVTSAGKLVFNVQMFVLETPTRRIAVDTCIGNDKTIGLAAWSNRQGRFLDDLEAMGLPTDSFDTVLCTHLHVDHVGWNTRKLAGRWIPTFPRARYLLVEEELRHWRGTHDGFGEVLRESIDPVLDAGLGDLVGTSHDVGDGIRLEPTPGHTPGHVSVRIRSRGEEAILTGDMMHHPCQIARPDWSTPFDHDGVRSRATREAFLEAQADRSVLVLGTHFAEPVGGRIVRDGATYRLI